MSMNKKWIFILIIFSLFLPIIRAQAQTITFEQNYSGYRLLDNGYNTDQPIGENICTSTQDTLRFLGYLLIFGKILVPIIIIFMGSLDYFKVVTSGKDDDLKKQTITLLKRILSGFLIFFIPTFLNVTFTLINDWSTVASEYEVCATCLLDPNKCNSTVRVGGGGSTNGGGAGRR